MHKKTYVMSGLTLFLLLFKVNVYAKLTNLSALKQQGSLVSAMVMRLNDQKILAEISPNTHLIPASTTKLALAALALQTWDSDKTFPSSFFYRGQIKDGILQGDLIFYGGGDPGFLNENMPDFINQMRHSGIKEITGHVIVNNSLFGALKQDKARAKAQKYSQNVYDAPLSAAALNYSIMGFMITPGNKIGAKAKVQQHPFSLPSATIVNNTHTTKGSKTQLNIERHSNATQDIYTVSGTIGVNAHPRTIYRSVSNPDRYAGEILAAYLKDCGIKMAHLTAKVENSPLLATDKLLFTVHGFPLSHHLNGLLKQSNNFVADMLLMDLNIEKGKKFKSQNEFTIEDQSEILQDYLRKVTKDNKIVIKSGSGLTPENRLSANNLVTLLSQIYQKPDQFHLFLNALTSPGEVGTLQHRFSQSSKVQQSLFLRAKTGTLSSPCFVVALAGYGLTKEHKWIGFAVIVNSKNTKKAPGIGAIQNAIDKDIVSFFMSGAKR